MTAPPARSERVDSGHLDSGRVPGRWRLAGAALVFLLGLAPSPLGRPGMEGPVPSGPSPMVQPEMACMRELLPPDAVVLLFSSPDGAMQLDPGLHYLVQAQLAPRLLISRPPGDRAFTGAAWFLGLAGGRPGAAALGARHQLVPVGQCGPWSVLRKKP